MLPFRDIQLLAIGAAAVIDTALLLVLFERRNWRRVVLPVVRQEIAKMEMLRDAKVDVGGMHFEKAGRVLVLREALGYVRPDPIAVENAADFLLERHHHGERGLFDHLAVRSP